MDDGIIEVMMMMIEMIEVMIIEMIELMMIGLLT